VPENRKKTQTYRFNGYPHSNPKSIFPIGIADLQGGIRDLTAKLADPNDPDDKKWVARWLQRYTKELEKKRKGIALKLQSKRSRGDRWKELR
jgi:hypothetical protein